MSHHLLILDLCWFEWSHLDVLVAAAIRPFSLGVFIPAWGGRERIIFQGCRLNAV